MKKSFYNKYFLRYLSFVFLTLTLFLQIERVVAMPLLPPPVDIPIQNIPQQQSNWCWVAVVQQIIAAKHWQNTGNIPQQCELVSLANNLPQTCCNNPISCNVGGTTAQIQWLINNFGGSFTTFQLPTNPMVLYNTLASGKAVIIQLNSGYVAHVVVVRGMYFSYDQFGNAQPFLYINDPLGVFPQSVPFSNIAAIWTSSIVVY